MVLFILNFYQVTFESNRAFVKGDKVIYFNLTAETKSSSFQSNMQIKVKTKNNDELGLLSFVNNDLIYKHGT